MNEEFIMSVEDVAEFLQLGNKTIYALAHKQEIPCRRIGNQFRFSKQQIIDWVRNPNYPAPEAVGPTEENRSKGEPVRRILIADDDPMIIEMLSDQFSSALKNVEIRTALNGVEALVIVGIFQPEILILDINMPGINGNEVCSQLKASPVAKDIFIITITGFPDENLEKDAKEAGCDLFIRKPFRAEDMVEIVRKRFEQTKLQTA